MACVCDCGDTVCTGCVNKSFVVEVMCAGREVQSPGAGRY